MQKILVAWLSLLCFWDLGVNFTNILQDCFLYKSKFCGFSLNTDWLCDFLAKGYWPLKMLVKLTTRCVKALSKYVGELTLSVNFTNILHAVFCTKVFYKAFLLLQFNWLWNFFEKILGQKLLVIESVNVTFCKQLLRQKIYADFRDTQYRLYSAKI